MLFTRRSAAFLIWLSFLFSGFAGARPTNEAQRLPKAGRTAIRAARYLDVARGAIIVEAVVVVENEKIVSIGSGTPVPTDAKTIDLGDATLLPGLIDAHTHLTYHFDENGRFGESTAADPQITLKNALENARLTLEAGFTTIRNLGDATGVDIFLRDAVRRGEATGPRMIVSGLPLTVQTLRAANKKGDRAEQIRQFVRDRIADGADVIKIFEAVDAFGNPVFSAKEIRAAVDEARRANRQTAVHAHEAAAIVAAVEGGCETIEHGTFLSDEAIRLMTKNRAALVPTVYLPTHYLEHRKQFAFEPAVWNFFETMKAQNAETVKRAKRRGLLIVNGSDAVAGMHGRNAREIVRLAKAGLKPAEAVRAATIDAADALGLKGQTGELRAGMLADMIAVPGNPLDDISALERVSFVMKSGVIVKSK